MEQTKQLFFSHTWQADKLGRNTHSRVYELAKELGTDSKTVIQILKENESIGTVKNHMSSVDEHQKGVVKLGLKVETTKLAFSESDLDETSFDEYVDDDTKPSLYDVVKEDVEVAPTGDEDGDLSFGQKAFAKAKSEEMTSAEKIGAFWWTLSNEVP